MCDRSFDIWPKSIGTNHLGERDLSHEIKFANFQVYLFQNGDGFAFYTISVSCKQNQPCKTKTLGRRRLFHWPGHWFGNYFVDFCWYQNISRRSFWRIVNWEPGAAIEQSLFVPRFVSLHSLFLVYPSLKIFSLVVGMCSRPGNHLIIKILSLQVQTPSIRTNIT